MNRFNWYEAASVEAAQKEVNATVSETIQPDAPDDAAVFKAAGIDLLDLMKEGLSRPSKLVGVRNIPGLGELSFDSEKGMVLGANLTIAEIAGHQAVKEYYPALHLAASQTATPQVRNMATLGGNLAQRTRCWYFRSIEHRCFRKGSSTCFAHTGENENHAILGYGYCVSVHASSLATALLAYDAVVEIRTAQQALKVIPIKEFFVLPTVDRTRENILEAGDLIESVLLPAPGKNTASHYLKAASRKSQDWPLAEVAVVAELSGKKCRKATIVLGAAAPVPFVAEAAMDAISDKTINESTAAAAAKAAMQSAVPLSQNAYKITVFGTLIKRALLALVK